LLAFKPSKDMHPRLNGSAPSQSPDRQD